MFQSIINSEAPRLENPAPAAPKPLNNPIPAGVRLLAVGEIIRPSDTMRMKGRAWAPVEVNHCAGCRVEADDHLDFFRRVDGDEVTLD